MNRFIGRTRRSWFGASLFAAVFLLGSLGAAQAAEEAALKPDAALTPVGSLEKALRPQGVPDNFVVTPNGYFDPSCVQVVREDEQLHQDGSIRRADGSLRKPALCSQSHFALDGTRIEPNGRVTFPAAPKPTINGWVIDTNYVSGTPIGRIVASWKVPSNPSSSGSQVIYFFPGLEQLPNVQSILQPVLGWNGYNDHAWTMASWNCCVSGTTYHSSPINVSVGDSITGDTYSNCSPGVSCSTWKIVSKDVTKGTSTTLTTNPYASLTWVFGGVLEAYGVSSCSQYPSNGSIAFSNIKVYDLNQVQVASPPWTKDYPVGSTSPQCNYGITATASSTNLVY